VVAAYLMYSRGLDPDAALALIREARPIVQSVYSLVMISMNSHIKINHTSCDRRPNEGFMEQLDIFHDAGCDDIRTTKAGREWYAKRAQTHFYSK
jgi:hypothetical protein